MSMSHRAATAVLALYHLQHHYFHTRCLSRLYIGTEILRCRLNEYNHSFGLWVNTSSVHQHLPYSLKKPLSINWVLDLVNSIIADNICPAHSTRHLPSMKNTLFFK